MAFIVEDGTGVTFATSLVTVAYVTAYLTDRNRETENSWSTATTAAQQAACIEGTDYLVTRWGLRFNGKRLYTKIVSAKATLTLDANPADTETVTLGSRTYTFNTSLGGADSVLIGDNASDSIDNLVAAINAGTGEGTLYGTGTVEHPDVSASAYDLDTMVASAKDGGLAGNLIASTETLTDGAWSSATLIGGHDQGLPQPLPFPRDNLYDREGTLVADVPDRAKQAVAEYAVRAINARLAPDPSVDASGASIDRSKLKIGSLEIEDDFTEGTQYASLARPYPAADRLLQEYVTLADSVIR